MGFKSRLCHVRLLYLKERGAEKKKVRERLLCMHGSV